MKRIEFVDHTADIIIRASGDTLAEAFAAAADGMFSIITDTSRIEPRQEVTFSVSSIDRPGLLVAFLSELIVRHEVDRLLLTDFTVVFNGETDLTATGRGELFDRSRHESGMHVKAVTYHMLEIEDGSPGGPCHVQVLFDV